MCQCSSKREDLKVVLGNFDGHCVNIRGIIVVRNEQMRVMETSKKIQHTERETDKSVHDELPKKEHRDIADDGGVGRRHIADLRELGAKHSRDDDEKK